MKLFFGRGFAFVAAAERPNILWLVQEDTSPWLGCYGHGANIGQTPAVDKLAKDGVLFKRAYVPVGRCLLGLSFLSPWKQ